MLSTIPAFSFAEPGLVNPFSDFQTGFTPWERDCSDLYSVVQSSLSSVEPDRGFDGSNVGFVGTTSGFENTNAGSDESSAGSFGMNTGSDGTDAINTVPSPQLDDPNSEEPKNLITVANSGSEGSNRSETELNGSVSNPTEDERKRKRMESNRESAKRSRMRKQKHVENLRDQVNRLGLENRELGNRLRLVLYHFQRVVTDNYRLAAEQEILRRRLSETRRLLAFRQTQQQQPWARSNNNNNNVTMTTEQNPFLIIDQML